MILAECDLELEEGYPLYHKCNILYTIVIFQMV